MGKATKNGRSSGVQQDPEKFESFKLLSISGAGVPDIMRYVFNLASIVCRHDCALQLAIHLPHHRHRGALPARKYDLHKWLKPVYPSRNERLLLGIQKE
jgi:hypothetical protein